MTFFSEMGAASWLGVGVACALVGGITAMLAQLGVRTEAKSFPGLFGALMGQACEDAMHMSHGLLMAILASVMLAAGGELARLRCRWAERAISAWGLPSPAACGPHAAACWRGWVARFSR